MSGIDRAAIVAEARSWMGTPYQHQQHHKAIATDCAGLVAGVMQQLGVLAADWWTVDGAEFAGYGRQPDGLRLVEALQRHMEEIAPAAIRPGDVIALRFQRDPQHLAIVADYRHGGLSMVHALSTAGRVTEHRLDRVWRDRITHAFRVPGIA